MPLPFPSSLASSVALFYAVPRSHLGLCCKILATSSAWFQCPLKGGKNRMFALVRADGLGEGARPRSRISYGTLRNSARCPSFTRAATRYRCFLKRLSPTIIKSGNPVHFAPSRRSWRTEIARSKKSNSCSVCSSGSGVPLSV